MKLVSYRGAGTQVKTGVVVRERVIDLTALVAAIDFPAERADALARRALAVPPAGMLRLLYAGPHALRAVMRQVKVRAQNGLFERHPPLGDTPLLAPIPRPGKIVAIGHNYAAHAKETGVDPFAKPRIIAKLSSSVVGPGAVVTRPAAVTKLDFEAELAVVIGEFASKVPRAKAFDVVAGYTALNDLSAREFQLDVSPPQTTFAKSMDGSCPMGPWLVTKDEIPDPQALHIACFVNGETMQRGSSADMLFPVDRLIEYITQYMTLEPGDVIATGTPAGSARSASRRSGSNRETASASRSRRSGCSKIGSAKTHTSQRNHEQSTRRKGARGGDPRERAREHRCRRPGLSVAAGQDRRRLRGRRTHGCDRTDRRAGYDAGARPVGDVENRPGANAIIATEAVARATPDGYTLLFSSLSLLVNAILLEHKVKYDPFRDFAPVSNAAVLPMVVVTSPETRLNSMQELVALAKAKPGEVSYGTSGNGGSTHLAGAMLENVTGTTMINVPFKGNGPALAEVLAGRVTFMFYPIVGIADQVSAKKLKVLAVGTPKHHPDFPGAPTMAEFGLPGFEDTAPWVGMLAPAGTPAPIVDRLSEELRKSLAKPETTERLKALGANTVGDSPAEFLDFLRRDYERWARVIRAAGVKAE